MPGGSPFKPFFSSRGLARFSPPGSRPRHPGDSAAPPAGPTALAAPAPGPIAGRPRRLGTTAHQNLPGLVAGSLHFPLARGGAGPRFAALVPVAAGHPGDPGVARRPPPISPGPRPWTKPTVSFAATLCSRWGGRPRWGRRPACHPRRRLAPDRLAKSGDRDF